MTHSDSSPLPAARAWVATLAAALAAALITWAAGEALMKEEIGSGSRSGRIPVSPVVASTRNGMTSYGILGATLGLGLGLAGGLIRGSGRSGVVAGVLGLVVGGAAGAVAARGLVPYYFGNYSGVSLTPPLIAHGGIWTSVALAAGLAFGLGLGGPRRAIEVVVYAALGALLATFLYEFSAAWLFPAAQADRPLPVTSASRLFLLLVVGLVIGAALAFSASRTRSPEVDRVPSAG